MGLVDAIIAGCAIIGAITGIAGLALSYTVHKRTEGVKALDLRLDLRRTRDDAERAVTRAREILEQAIASRKSVATLAGASRSGSMEKWKKKWESDSERIDELASQIPDRGHSYEALGPDDLEAKLVDLHRTNGRLHDLIESYEGDLRQDEKQRETILKVRSDFAKG